MQNNNNSKISGGWKRCTQHFCNNCHAQGHNKLLPLDDSDSDERWR